MANISQINGFQINAQTASFVTASNVYGPYGSNSVISASHAVNGGVTQLLAGSNITLSPTTGKGQVTISSTGGGGPFFNTATGSYGSFYSTSSQTNPVANIPRSMSLDNTDITNGVSISGSTNPFNTYIKTENAGVYNIQFSAQLDKTDAGKDEIVIWLRKNGTDLTDTATSVSLTNNNDKVVAAWNWFVNSAANDYYQIIWYSADTNIRLLAETAGGGHPGIPSVIVTANRVDQFLSNTGSFSGSFTGVFTGSLQGTAATASYTPNALVTASVSLNTITFTKGDGSTFPITVNTGSGGGSTNTGSLLTTASVSLNTITFTKGDGSTFPITVNTGSSSPASSVTQSFRMQSTAITIPGSSGNRFTPITVFINTATEPVTQLYIEYPITLKQLIIRTTNTQPATGNYTIALRKNGADTALLITIPSSSAASVFSSSADVSLVTGDLIAYRLNNSASTTSTNVTQMSLLYV